MAIQPLYPSTRPSLNLDFANTKTLDPRITFSRASTATYYDGKTFTKAEENLLIYSQEFDNAAWTKTASTVTANATAAPDGTTTADKVIATATVGYHAAQSANVNLINGVTYTVSVYVKAAEYTKFYISEAGWGYFACSFDLVAGTVGTPVGGATSKTASIVNLGNGYYRCSITFTASATSTASVGFIGYPDTGATLGAYGAQYTGDGTSGIYIWGAQLEQRSSATAYTPTTSQPITNYIPVLQTAAANTPRFDHDPTTGESLGLLIEEQRTNLLLQSQFAASWGNNNAALLVNSAIAPDGTLTAAKTYPTTPAGYGGGSRSQTVAKSGVATTYTYSIFAKIGEANRFNLYIHDLATTTNRAQVEFSLVDGSIVGAATHVGTFTASSASAGTPIGNGWYRFSLTFTSSTETSITARIYVNDSVLTTANGYSGIYIWGAQLEAGSFPTSYIPTTTAQVTRSADAASMTGSNFSSWYRQDEGTIFIENNYNHGGTDDGKVALHVDNAAGSRFMLHNSGSLNRLVVTVNNTEVVSISGATPASKSFVKTAFAIKTNDFASSSNAANASVDTSGNVPIVSAMRLGTYESPGYELNGHIKRLCYWPSRLSNSVIQALTT